MKVSSQWCLSVILAMLGSAMLASGSIFNCTLQSTNPQLDTATAFAIDATTGRLVSTGSSLDYCPDQGGNTACGRFTFSDDGGVGWTNMNSTQYGLTTGVFNITMQYNQICSSDDGKYILAAGDGPYIYGTEGQGTAALSTDGGLTWTAVPIPYNVIGYRGIPYGIYSGCAMSTDGNVMYLTTKGDPGYASGQVFRSTNFGAAWATVEPDITTNEDIWEAVASSTNGQTVIVCSYLRYCFVSINGGTSWRKATVPLGAQAWYAAAMNDDGYKIWIAAASPSKAGIYYSGDRGETWSLIPGTSGTSGTSGDLVAWYHLVASRDGSTVVATSELDKVYVSTDGGQTFSFEGNYGKEAVLTADAQTLYTVDSIMGGAVYKCTRGIPAPPTRAPTPGPTPAPAVECNTPAQTTALKNVEMSNQITDKTKRAKRDPFIIQTVTLTNTNKFAAATGLVLEMLGYDDLDLVSFKVASTPWAKDSIKLTDYGDLVVTNEFSIPAGKTVTLDVKYKVRNCPAKTDFNFYAQLMIPAGGDACYKYTPMPMNANCAGCYCKR